MFSSSVCSTSGFSVLDFDQSTAFTTIQKLHLPLIDTPETVQDEAARLIVLVAQGCETSFKRLIRLSRNRLFTIVSRINSDEAQAEEIVQEVYLKVWICSDRFLATQTNGNGWLNAMARNAAVDSLRRNACRPALENLSKDFDEDPYAPVESPLNGPLQILIASRRGAYISASVKSLPIQDQLVVKMSFFDELSHQQIATYLDKPLGTIKTRIRRALLKMKLTTPLDV